ncbi:MAG: hypothetical protein IJX09_05455, partial [Clostridia bacterium]|nr:hypothetical protein [Clostridia bacterium]
MTAGIGIEVEEVEKLKKNFIRTILITFCFAVFMLASAIGVVFSMPKSARAESAIPQGVFEMEDGVS